MYYIIYKTTNLINDKVYIGYHSTEDINDSYLGSGKLLKQAIKKYGENNFKRDILYVFPTKEEALLKESEIVNEAFIYSESNYNIKLGGEGGWDHTYNDPEISKRRKEGVALAFAEGRSTGWQLSKEQRNEIGRSSFKGKKHTKETLKKISEAGKTNPEVEKNRIESYHAEPKTWGWKTRLSQKWGIKASKVAPWLKSRGLI